MWCEMKSQQKEGVAATPAQHVSESGSTEQGTCSERHDPLGYWKKILALLFKCVFLSKKARKKKALLIRS